MRAWVGMVIAMLMACGCQVTPRANPAESADVVFVLHGADGAGVWYRELTDGLGGTGRPVELVQWGAPLMVLPNLQLPALHDAAEDRLRERVLAWHHEHPTGRIDLVGHSAGCGVILQTLSQLPEDVNVQTVVLLAPAVSPKYDLTSALKHVRGTMHSFYSPHDKVLLMAGTGLAGTYDNVWGAAAGLHGFKGPSTQAMAGRFVDHEYQEAWKSMGHDGGHFGYRSKAFVAEVLVPMLK